MHSSGFELDGHSVILFCFFQDSRLRINPTSLRARLRRISWYFTFMTLFKSVDFMGMGHHLLVYLLFGPVYFGCQSRPFLRSRLIRERIM